MKKNFIKRIFKCHSGFLLDIVADVESYSEFLPLCKKVEILDNWTESSVKKFRASVLIEYKFFKERFVSEVTVDKVKSKITIKSSDNPFKALNSEWVFEQIEDDCLVSFFLDTTFKSFVIQKIISLSFDRIAEKVMNAFEERATLLRLK